MTSNPITIKMGAKYRKQNKILLLYTLNLEVIHITLTSYYIGNDT